jgi:general secretion pathway protein D
MFHHRQIAWLAIAVGLGAMTPWFAACGAREEEQEPPAAKERDDDNSARRAILSTHEDEDDLELHIARALLKPASVDFQEKPLEECLRHLQTEHEFTIWIDRAAMEESGLNLNQPVTLKLSGVRCISVLNLLLEPNQLEWLIQDEIVKVTTAAGAERRAEFQTYAVQDLIDAGHEPDQLVSAIQTCVCPETWMDAGEGTGTISHSGGVLVVRQVQRVHSQIDALLEELRDIADDQEEKLAAKRTVAVLKVYRTDEFPADELAESIPALIAPDTWTEKGGEGRIQAISGALMIKQTGAVHRQIEQLLAQLIAKGKAT